MLLQNDSKQRLALKTQQMVGRTVLLNHIEQAIQRSKPSQQVIYVYGTAGIGKTRLLDEVGRILDSANQNFNQVAWTGIIDLFDENLQNPAVVEETIANRLDPHNQIFTSYRAVRQKLANQATAGFSETSTQKSRNILTQAFISDYSTLATNSRTVLTFDTVELLRHERDEAQDRCGIEASLTSLTSWFIDNLPELDNTVTVLAGRYDPNLVQALRDKFGELFHPYEIFALTEKEAGLFLDTLINSAPRLQKLLTPTVQNQLYELTSGRPIYLSLVIDVLTLDGQVEISRFLPATATNDFQGGVSEDLEASIVEHLVHLPEPYEAISFALTQLAYARQGLDAELLAYLSQGEWSDTFAKQVIKDLSQYTFIKTPSPTAEVIYFHDELYDLFDRQYLQDRAEETETYQRFEAFYRNKYEKIEIQLINLRSDASREAVELRYRLIKERENIAVKLLYYALHVHPGRAYYSVFAKWDLEAIRSNNIEFDMRLRSVLLRFINRYIKPDGIAYNQWLANRLDLPSVYIECAVRWVRRLNALGERHAADLLARKLRHDHIEGFDWDKIDDQLYKANLLTAWSEALYYAPQHEVFELLKAAETILENDGFVPDENRSESRFRSWLLALTKNNLGFQYRVRYQLTTALTYYQEAIRLYREINILPEMATTINNLAYVYGLLSGHDQALTLVDDGLELRRQLAQLYNEAIGLRTKTLILLNRGDLFWADFYSRQAEKLLLDTNLTETVGFALVQLIRGRVNREKANFVYQNVYTPKEAELFFEQSKAHFSHAEELLPDQSNYSLELHQELGHLQRDLMMFYKHFGRSKLDIRDCYKLAEYSYTKAKILASDFGTLDHEINIIQNEAYLFHLNEETEKAVSKLDLAQSRIPEEYKLQASVGLPAIDQPVTRHYLEMGRIYRLRGRILTSQQTKVSHHQLLEIVEWYVIAFIYFHRASPFSDSMKEVHKSRVELYNLLKGSNSELLQEVQGKLLAIRDKYNVDLDLVASFMENTLGSFGFTST